MDNILTSIKKLLGIEETYTHFDEDIRIHINSAFMTLSQIGVGPSEGFVVKTGAETWTEFLNSDVNVEAAKTFVYYNVRLGFDPPEQGFVVEALKSQIKELAWRLIVQTEPKEEV